MSTFNWNQIIKTIPDDWRDTLGENVKVAVLDSGIDLKHPALSHLDKSGRKFNVATLGFDPSNDPLSGEDNIEDAVPLRHAHGTHCTSIIAALPEGTGGINGVAPAADIFTIKIIDDNKESLLEYFIKGMQVAIQKDVDVISVSYFPFFQDPVDQAAIDDIFAQVKAKRIAIVAPLENTSRFKQLNKLKFPATRDACIVAGVLRNRLAKSFPREAVFSQKINFLLPQVEAKYCTLFRSNKYIERKISSSYVVATISGIIALLIAHWKKTEPNYQRRTKEELLLALDQITRPFNIKEIVNNPSFQIYKP